MGYAGMPVNVCKCSLKPIQWQMAQTRDVSQREEQGETRTSQSKWEAQTFLPTTNGWWCALADIRWSNVKKLSFEKLLGKCQQFTNLKYTVFAMILPILTITHSEVAQWGRIGQIICMCMYIYIYCNMCMYISMTSMILIVIILVTIIVVIITKITINSKNSDNNS